MPQAGGEEERQEELCARGVGPLGGGEFLLFLLFPEELGMGLALR